MGDPKYPRRVWKKPKRPLNYELKMDELKTLGTFGLRTKRELWKAHTELSRVRHQARSLLALRQEIREEREPILMKSLARIGLVSADSTLDDVLNLQVNDLLARRLQTIVFKKLGFKTPYHARQAVVHGHIMIDDRKINIPSYTVSLRDEDKIRFAPESTIPEMLEKEKREKSKSAELGTKDNAPDAKDGVAPKSDPKPWEAKESTSESVKESQESDAKPKVKENTSEEVKESTSEEVKESTSEEVKEAQESKPDVKPKVKESTSSENVKESQEKSDAKPEEIKENTSPEEVKNNQEKSDAKPEDVKNTSDSQASN